MKNKSSLRRGVMDKLGQKIVQGHYQPGTVLSTEQDLAAKYEVSRTVIREAVKGLAARGLLSSRPNVGATINERQDWQWLDSDVIAWALDNKYNRADLLLSLYEAFAFVNPAVIENVAENATLEEIERIAAAYQGLEDTLGDIDAWDQAINEWYSLLYQICRNVMLQNIALRLMDVFSTHLGSLSASKLAQLAPHIKLPWLPSSTEALHQHRQIYYSIEIHDSEIAFLTARRLFKAVMNNLQILTKDSVVRQLLEETQG